MTIVDTIRHARADLLDRTADMIDDACPLDQEGFTDAVRAIRVAGVQAIEIARPHGVAVSTITRWEKGQNHPHPAMRKVLGPRLALYARRAAQKLREACDKEDEALAA